jgi:hypothetical protein
VTDEVPISRIGHSFTKINNEKFILFGRVGNSLNYSQYLNDHFILDIQKHDDKNNLED